MSKYKITYEDCDQIETTTVHACDSQTALEAFFDAMIDWQGDCYGLQIIEIRKLKPTFNTFSEF